MSVTSELVDIHVGGVRLLQPPAAVTGAIVAFTDRCGGASSSPFDSLNLAVSVGDDPHVVSKNRAAVARAAGFDPDRLRLAKQVHGAEAIEVTANDPPVAGEADIVYTSEPGTAIGILTADCTPVVLLGHSVVAVAHAGWRGLAAGVVETAVALVGEVKAAWIGPSIHACCYEVGPEVVDAFRSHGLPVAGERRVDPGRAAAFALHRAGVGSVGASSDCTSCDMRYFSYRRDGLTGRQGAFVALTAG